MTIIGTGAGGPNQEDSLGIVGEDSLARPKGLGLDPATFLANNASTSFFDLLGDLVRSGPTQTNVNDFRAILIDPA